MGVSIGEIFVVAIIALLVVKPEEVPHLLRRALKIKDSFFSVVSDVKTSIFSVASAMHEEVPSDEMEEMNLYLKKIMQRGKEYSGEYNLNSVKRFYHRMVLTQDDD